MAVGSILCRRPVSADIPKLAQVDVSAWQVGFQGLLPQPFLDGLDPARARARFEEDLTPGRKEAPHFLLAEQDGIVLGFSAFGPSRDEDAGSDVGEVFALHVAPASWGRGVGSSLL